MVKVVILCGGTENDLTDNLRQFITLAGESYNLYEQTLLRSQQLNQECSQLIVVSNCEIHEKVVNGLIKTNIKCPITILWEPVMRNTGPCVGYLVKFLQKYHFCDDDQKCLIFPSDHVLSVDALNRSLLIADQLLESNLITFGVYPTYPETNYGYIIEGDNRRISKFIEKPQYGLAKDLINNPSCFWNSGLYLFSISVVVKEYEMICHHVFNNIEFIEQRNDDNGYVHVHIDSVKYGTCPTIPFDKLIMEKTMNGCVVPFRGLWSDVGSWENIHQVSEQYKSVNCHQIDSKNCHIYNYNHQQVISLIGIDNVCVINTKDTILVSNLSDTYKVRDMAQTLEDQYVKKSQRGTKLTKYLESLGINMSVLYMIVMSYLNMDT